MNRNETLPATDFDKLLDRERTLAGLPARIDLSQITGLWRLVHSYRYDPERRSWVTPISHLHDDVRTRFDANGTLEEYEAEFTTIRSSYLLDPQRGTLTWENCEHYIVSLMPSYMVMVIYEPVTEKRDCEETYKFVYERLSILN